MPGSVGDSTQGVDHASHPAKTARAAQTVRPSIRAQRRPGDLPATVVQAEARFIADAENLAEHPSCKDAVLLRQPWMFAMRTPGLSLWQRGHVGKLLRGRRGAFGKLP